MRSLLNDAIGVGRQSDTPIQIVWNMYVRLEHPNFDVVEWRALGLSWSSVLYVPKQLTGEANNVLGVDRKSSMLG